MDHLENNDFMILNNILYKIHTHPDFNQMRHELLEQINKIVAFNSADFSLSAENDNCHLSQQISYQCTDSFSKVFEDLDYSQGILAGGKSMVYRESDIISEEKRVETEYYKKVYLVNHWHYALQIILGYQEEFLGVITLYKERGQEDFRDTEIFLMDLMKDHLAYRIFTEKESTCKTGEKLSIPQATRLYSLTPRECDILKLVLLGKENQEICTETFITNNTLKKHILNIYKKVQVRNRVQLFQRIEHLP